MSNEILENENNTSVVNPTSDFILENDELFDSSVANNFTRGRGIKVLVVDDDVTCLSIITKYLNFYQYQVISKSNPVEALNLLEKNEEKINLLLTDVCMEGIDGFKLLEVAKKHDIPVIMMSGYNDEEIVMKGVTYGARNHLLKPIKLTDVQHIWQHVLRNNLEKGINNNIDCDNEDHQRDNKRIDCDNEDHRRDNKTNKKEGRKSGGRVRWNDDLHRDFVSVVESLGGEDKAVPKKILEILNGKPNNFNFTREQVASHLQKYRKNKVKNNNNNNNGATTSSIMDHSFMVPNPAHSDQFTSLRHPLPVAQNYNHPHSMINYVVGQPQQPPQPQQQQLLQVRPSQMIMQPPRMMQFGRNNLMGSNKLPQVNFQLQQQLQQQQQAQQLMNFGDSGSLHMNFFDSSDRVMPVLGEDFDANLIVNPTPNSFLNDGNNHLNNWGNDFPKSS